MDLPFPSRRAHDARYASSAFRIPTLLAGGEVAIPSIKRALDLRLVVRTLVVNAAASYTFLLRYASKS